MLHGLGSMTVMDIRKGDERSRTQPPVSNGWVIWISVDVKHNGSILQLYAHRYKTKLTNETVDMFFLLLVFEKAKKWNWDAGDSRTLTSANQTWPLPVYPIRLNRLSFKMKNKSRSR